MCNMFPIDDVLPQMKYIKKDNTNSIDPNQTLRSFASDLGLHCLPMSLLWRDRH